MYIKNFDVVKSKVIICSRKIGEYLEKNNIPLLSQSSTGNLCVYVYTEVVEKLMNELPEELKKEGYFIE